MPRLIFSAVAAVFFGLSALPAVGDDFADCTGLRTARTIPACTTLAADASLDAARRQKVLLARGQAYLAQAAKDDAERDFSEAIRVAPTVSSGYLARAQLFIGRNEAARALGDLDHACQLSPKDPAVFALRGQTYLGLKQADPALADFETALRLKPGDAATFAGRGRAYALKGRHDRAVADLTEAIRMRPDLVAPLLDRARSLEALGNPVRALADGQQALKIDPRHADAAALVARLSAKPADVAAAETKAKPAEGIVRTEVKAAPEAQEAPAAAIVAGRRVALVIGNGGYTHEAQLRNPSADARASSAALASIGFEVETVLDADRGSFAGALKRFSSKADGADVALIYYSGHGVQVARGAVAENYLLPIDAEIKDARDIDDEAFSLSRVLERSAGAKVRVAVLDACRDNPFAKRLAGATRGSAARGLGRVDMTDHGSLVVYATQPNNVAKDGDGDLSPFTAAFVTEVVKPGLDVRLMIARVRERVFAATHGEQKPYSDDGLIGEVYLAGR